jgi:hypothetical protein
MAIDAGAPHFLYRIVLKGKLFVESHVCDVVTITALTRVSFLHLFPHTLCHQQASAQKLSVLVTVTKVSKPIQAMTPNKNIKNPPSGTPKSQRDFGWRQIEPLPRPSLAGSADGPSFI